MKMYKPTTSQRLIWLDQLIDKASAKYNIGGYAFLDGELNYAYFRQAIRQVLLSQEVYASRFFEADGELACGLTEQSFNDYDIEMIDFSLEAYPEEKAVEWMESDFALSFEMENQYLFNFRLLKISDTRHFWYAKIHHIISDGWSFKLLLNQAADLYSACAGKEEYPPTTYKYSDYALEDDAYYNSEEAVNDRAFWLSEYKQLPPELFRNGMNKVQNDAAPSGSHTLYLSAATKATLKSFADAHKCSLFQLVTGLLLVYFSRTRQQQDVCVAVPVLNRTRKVYRSTAGVFMNLLPLKFQLSPADTIPEVLSNVRQKMSAMLRHQRYQYGNLVKDLKLPVGKLLYDIRISYEDFQFVNNFGDIKTGAIALSNYAEADKLAIYVRDYNDEGFDIRFVYNKSYFTEDIIQSISDSLEYMVSSTEQLAQAPISALPLLTPEQTSRILTLSCGPTSGRTGRSFLEMWDRARTAYVNNIAVATSSSLFTYSEIDAMAGKVAGALAAYRQTHGSMVALMLPRSEKMITGMLGAMMAGMTYIPIDPEYPAERIMHILTDAGCKVLLSSFELDHLTACLDQVTVLRTEQLQASSGAGEYPLTGADPEVPCYIIYTSGSTGTPKGVMISQASLADYTCTFREYFNVSERDVVMQQASMSFDTSVEEIFPVLSAGGKLYILEDRRDFISLLAALESERVSILSTNPFMLSLLNEHTLPSSLRVLISGGDILKLSYIENLLQQQVAIYNTYGPTESTVCATYALVQEHDSILPIGKPITNRQVYILDNFLNLQPIGVEGEIYLGGEGLSMGYVNSSALTAERFVTGFLNKQTPVYKTGDNGIMQADGNIIFTGRKDSQLSYRGYRIESYEIEKIVGAQNGVGDCVVDVREFENVPFLVAYVTYINGAQYTTKEWSRLLKNKLPAYMVPEVWISVPEMPLSLNGKIDKKLLPALDAGMFTTDSGTTRKPASPLEMKIAEIWKNILQQKEPGADSDFFELGGHSLNIAQLANQYYRSFEVKIPVRDLFNHTTIAAHAALIAGRSAVGYTAIEKAPSAEDYVVSDGQRRLWTLSQLEAESRAYHLPGYLELAGAYHPQHLETAIRYVIARHEILRTVFRENEAGMLRQVILPEEELSFSLTYNDRGLHSSDLESFLAAEASRSFDLSRGPLIRAGLIRQAPEKFIFYYTLHHIISDGWSMEILKKEVLAAYEAAEKGASPVLPVLPIQYKDYAVWQQQQLLTERFSDHRAYWLQQLSGELPVLALPAAKARPQYRTYNGYQLSTWISKDAVSGLHRLCLQEQCTLLMGLLGVMKALFYRYTGQEEIIAGIPTAGRDHADLEDQIGFYVNTLPLRTRFKGEDDFTTLLGHVREVALQAYAHQEYPFDRLVNELGLKRDMSRSAIFDVMIVLQNQQQIRSGETITAGITEAGECAAKFDLTIDFLEREEGLKVDVQFNTDIYDKASIILLLEHYKQLMQLLVSQPEAAISAHDYLSAAERRQLLETFNNTATAYPAGLTLPGLFHQQVQNNSGRIALIHKHNTFTYGELDALSNQLARYLVAEYDVAGEELIAIRLPRSEWLIIALLGVQKAGCAYIPVDPSYPQERIDFMLTDSQCRVCIDEGLLEKFRKDQHCYSPLYFSVPVNEHSLAYVLYTSGSTGRPKGCMLEHKAIVNRLEWMWREYGFNAADVILQKTTFTFDVSVWELFLPLCWGCQMVLCEDQDIYVPERIAALIDTHGVTTIHFVPSMLQAFMGVIFESPEPAAWQATLKRVIASGEALPVQTIQRWYSVLDIPIYNLYGPTEAGIDVTHYRTRKDDEKVLIGRPVANTRLYILDSKLQLVPVGVTGELYIGGVQLARGYLNRDALTAERFIADPYQEGARLYKTGDLCRWAADGNIAYLGRSDGQVKIRGYRIELGEVEQALLEQEGITAATVLACTTENGQPYLSGYIVSETVQNSITLRYQLLNRLPEYMIPAHFVQLDKIPLTANGKVDRKALPAPVARQDRADTYVPPGSETEIVLVKICEEILNQQRVSIKDNFFDLGATSLTMIAIRARIRAHFNLLLNINDLYNLVTLEDLAETIDSLRWLSQDSSSGNVQRTEEFII